jgi:glutathionylspermidine synthase
LEGSEGPLEGIVRFFPLEWLENLPRNSGWEGYFGAETASCNHPAALLSQSKRLPLLWDRLGVGVPAWRELLPETVDPRSARGDGWILKPALGRVGEGVSIREAIAAKEFQKIHRAARRHPGEWIAQRRFDSAPLLSGGGEALHLCVGVFTVDGKRAGMYGRNSPAPRIDAHAQDIPLLVSEEG